MATYSVLAIDWSGAALSGRSHIWLAAAESAGQLTLLECGRDRLEVSDYLTRLHDQSVAIGFDFAFSFPVWFLENRGLPSAEQLWQRAEAEGERWLLECHPPFWGRRGCPRPSDDHPRYRRTELAVPRHAGIGPKSVFQIGGAGSVGTGSIRGMPLLGRLAAAGATIWPFTASGVPTVVEIYPRLLTGSVRKSDPLSRERYLKERFPCLSPAHFCAAVASEDAFDAAVSALVMIEHVADLTTLQMEEDSELRLEGRIWHPRWREDRL